PRGAASRLPGAARPARAGRCVVSEFSTDVSAAFAEWLKAARREAGLSQREVAEAVAPNGFHWLQSKIAKIEGGELVPRLDESVALAGVFGVTLDVALGLKTASPVSEAAR